jgi:ketosteroid isomerase-like protein
MDLLKPVYAARTFEAGIPAMLAVMDPDIEFRPAGLWFDSRRLCRGHEELVAYFRELEEAFGELYFEPERFEERGDTVAIAVRLEARGRHSGLGGNQSLGHLWRFRARRAVELVGFLSPEEAFAALDAG